MIWFISDAHYWIQSSKTTIGNTVVVCTRCKTECETKNFTTKSCKPHTENPKAGFENKIYKYIIYATILNTRLLMWKFGAFLIRLFNKCKKMKR